MLRTILLFALIASFSCFAVSQDSKEGSNLLARLAYRSTYVHNSDEVAQSCFAVYRNGMYRLLRNSGLMLVGPGEDDLNGVVVQGQLTKGQLTRIKAMLRQLKRPSDENGLVLQGAETFTAEVMSDGESSTLSWVDADHQKPFPAAVSRVVRWLEDFRAQDSTRLTLHGLSAFSVCPPIGAKPVRPVIAGVEKQPTPQK